MLAWHVCSNIPQLITVGLLYVIKLGLDIIALTLGPWGYRVCVCQCKSTGILHTMLQLYYPALLLVSVLNAELWHSLAVVQHNRV